MVEHRYITEIQAVVTSNDISWYNDKMLQNYADVFTNSIQPAIKNYNVHIMDANATPIFRKFYRIPYSLEEKVKQCLNYRNKASSIQQRILNGPRP